MKRLYIFFLILIIAAIAAAALDQPAAGAQAGTGAGAVATEEAPPISIRAYLPVIQTGHCFICWFDDFEACNCPWCRPSIPGHVTQYCVPWGMDDHSAEKMAGWMAENPDVYQCELDNMATMQLNR